eukprot:TRINITY_DN4448_c0_g1_i1.p1 TRINITY_DN4448_c0_g1~~TRINITY_DN4448_c0_g1_i1.p1  ORF type:complete len:437 (+),score=126.60 TRINITY_DN4448_c0_g1_i1:193-1311(+)
MNDLSELMYQAELEEKDFAADRELVVILTSSTFEKRFQNQENLEKTVLEEKNLKNLKIPRRPGWDVETTAEELQHSEKEAFLKWRRILADIEQDQHLILTPYEKNLDVWRQLWRVVEKSELLVQIVDARNPLLFYCEDLFNYVKEVEQQQQDQNNASHDHDQKKKPASQKHKKHHPRDPDDSDEDNHDHDDDFIPNRKNRPKQTLLLVNKSDLLPLRLREAWAKYFHEHGIRYVFFSAIIEAEKENQTLDPNQDTDDSDQEEPHQDINDSDDDKSVEPYPPPHMKTKSQKKKKNRAQQSQKDSENETESDNETSDDDEIQDLDLPKRTKTIKSEDTKQEEKKETRESRKKGRNRGRKKTKRMVGEGHKAFFR